MIVGDVGVEVAGCVQAGWTNGQRGAKRQPVGGSRRSGGLPWIGTSSIASDKQVGEGVAQAHRVGMARPGQHLAHRAALDHLAGIHHHDLVAEIGDDRDVVRHQHHREVQPLLQAAQHVEYLALHDHVERGHRLVGQQQAGLERQRHGDRRALAHAAGELVRVVAQAGGRSGRPARTARPRVRRRGAREAPPRSASTSTICAPTV